MLNIRELIYRKLTNGFIDCFLYMAANYGDYIAIETPEINIKLSYKEMLLKIEQTKAMLERINVQKGDTVYLLLDSPLDFILCFFALASIEAVTMPVSITLTNYELEQIYNLCIPQYIISNAEILIRYQSTIEKFSGVKCIVCLNKKIYNEKDNKICYEYFSGCSDERSRLISPKAESVITCHYTYRGLGYPLGVCHTYQDYNLNMQGLLNVIKYEPGSTVLSFLPVYHVYGTVMIAILPLISGFKILNIKNILKYNFIDLFEKWDVKLAYFIPSLLKKVLRDAELIKDKRNSFSINPEMKILSSGSYLNEELIQQIYELLNVNILQGYGCVETLAVNFSSGYSDRGTLGKPIRDEINIKICNSEGNTEEAGRVGEIVIQSPSVASEFKGNSDTTRLFFKNNCFYSGDIGYVDRDGLLHFVGRASKIAKNNAQMVDLSEVSSIIRLLEDVVEVYTTTEGSLLLNQKIISFVILKKESKSSAKEIRMHCLAYLSKYKAPTEIYLYK